MTSEALPTASGGIEGANHLDGGACRVERIGFARASERAAAARATKGAFYRAERWCWFTATLAAVEFSLQGPSVSLDQACGRWAIVLGAVAAGALLRALTASRKAP